MQRGSPFVRASLASCLLGVFLVMTLLGQAAGAAKRPWKELDFDAQLARLTERHPTFGGMFVDGKRLKILLTDDGESLRGVYAALKKRYDEVRGYEPVALKARWNWIQLYEWRIDLGSKVSRLPGFLSSDIDDSGNRVEFGFKNRRRVIDRANEEIARQGVPRAAVRIVKDEEVTVDPG